MDIKDIREKLKDKLTYGKTKLEAGQYAKPVPAVMVSALTRPE